MFASVFLISLSAIAFEILLTRFFSISQWHHLSFMVISIALFGMAASGTYIGIAESRYKRWGLQKSLDRWMLHLSIFFSVSALLSFLIVRSLPLDYYKLPVHPIQAVYLMISYLSLAVPFFFAGLIIAFTYISIPEKTGIIYFMNMAGSALGALIPMVLLKPLGESKVMILIAILPLLICFSFSNPMDKTSQKHGDSSRIKSNRLAYTGMALFSICLAAIILLHRSNPLFNIPLSEYKALHQLLQYPDSRITRSSTGITGRVDTVHSPFLRFSPGLSLQYTGSLPRQFALFKDGEGRLVFYHASQRNDFLFASYSLPYAGYLLAPEDANVLIIQDGGGSAIACAMASGAKEVTVIEKHSRLAEMIRRHYHIPAVDDSPTRFLARTSNRFDIIHIEDWGPSLPGTAALYLNPRLTIESIKTYMEHLSPTGILILSRKLILPPSNMIRIAATVFEALRAAHVAHPRNHVAILRNWDTFTILVSKKQIQGFDILNSFASEKNFDWVWPQGSGTDVLNRFNKFKEPYYANAVQSLFTAFEAGIESRFFRDNPLDISPQTNNRPFPDKFFKWCKARTIHRMTGGRLYTLLLSGEIIVSIVFLEAVVIAGLLLLAPLWIVNTHRTKVPFTTILFFTAIGAGFILVEIFFIHTYTKIFNDPVLSFSIVLSIVLISSSAGGLISQRLRPASLKSILSMVGLLLILILLWLDPLLETIHRMPSHLCLLLSTLLLALVGILLGFPFPMGMRHLMNSPAHRAYAWATNGIASVLAAVVAAQLAISWGLTTLLWCAVVAYGVAWGALLGFKDLKFKEAI